MMVLHFIDKSVNTAANNVFDYLPAVLNSLSVEAEMCVFAPLKSDIKVDNSAVKMVSYHASALYVVANSRLFARRIKECQPAIAHIHGCGSVMSALFMRQCERLGVPVVITTGKQFEPWNLRHHYWLCRFSRHILYQLYILRYACALHSLSSQEKERLQHLSWHPLLKARKPINANSAVINNFNRTPAMTAGNMADQLSALYSKVADSNPFMLLTADDKRCEDVMLSVGLAPDPATVPVSEADSQLLAAIDEQRMRRILLHATDEGIYKYVIAAALRFKVRLPAVNIRGIARYNSYYRPMVVKPSANDTSIYAERINNDETLTETERQVCNAIISTWRKYREGTLCRADLAELYRLLRYTDYQEVLLCHALRRIHFSHRAARLLCVLSERYFLTEGFIPLPPKNDRRTQRMRRKLHRLGVE